MNNKKAEMNLFLNWNSLIYEMPLGFYDNKEESFEIIPVTDLF